MVYRMVMLHKFENGTLADAEQVNQVTEYFMMSALDSARMVGSHPLYGRVNSSVASTDFHSVPGSYFITGLLYDDYNGSVVDTSRNTFGSIASSFSTQGSAVFTAPAQNGGSLYWNGTYLSDVGISAGISMNVTFNRDIHTVGSIDVAMIQSNNSTTGGVSVSSRLLYGSVILDSTATGSNVYYIILNEAKTSASVYKNGTLSTVNIAGKTGSKFEFHITNYRSTGGPGGITYNINDVRFLGSGMVGTGSNYIIFNDNKIGSFGGIYLGSLSDLPQNNRGQLVKTNEFSMDNGVNYTTFTENTLSKTLNTGSTILTKISVVYPGSNSFYYLRNASYIYG